MQNVANVSRFFAIIAIEGRGFQHLPWDLANVNAWKTVFDPYIDAHTGNATDKNTLAQIQEEQIHSF